MRRAVRGRHVRALRRGGGDAVSAPSIDLQRVVCRKRAAVAGVPLLTPDKRNEARRFMVLVDALYERRVMLFVAAAAAPDPSAGEAAVGRGNLPVSISIMVPA